MSERITSKRDGHWLVFDDERRVTGCHCGFEADMDSDCGWGDSVVDHIWNAAQHKAQNRRQARIVRKIGVEKRGY